MLVFSRGWLLVWLIRGGWNRRTSRCSVESFDVLVYLIAWIAHAHACGLWVDGHLAPT